MRVKHCSILFNLACSPTFCRSTPNFSSFLDFALNVLAVAILLLLWNIFGSVCCYVKILMDKEADLKMLLMTTDCFEELPSALFENDDIIINPEIDSGWDKPESKVCTRQLCYNV